MEGTIRLRGDAVFVEHRSRMFFEPVDTIVRWRVTRVVRDGGGFPTDGDAVYSQIGSGGWRGRGYTVYFPGDQEAESTENIPVPPPAVRAGQTAHYRDGRWEIRGRARGRGRFGD